MCVFFVILIHFQFCSGSVYPRVVWSYWENETFIPEDVEEMMNVTRKSLANFTYILVTENNSISFFNVTSFPAFYPKLVPRDKSEYIRISVLKKFGGMYMDSTVIVNSGSEMEWVFSKAGKSQAEAFGFSYSKRGIYMNFMGASLHSEYFNKLGDALHEAMSVDFYRYCEVNFPRSNHERCLIACPDSFFESFNLKNKRLLNKLLKLPKSRSHYQFAEIECKNDYNCVRDRLLHDPVARSYPFIKLGQIFRTEKKFNFFEKINKTYIPKKFSGKGWPKGWEKTVWQKVINSSL